MSLWRPSGGTISAMEWVGLALWVLVLAMAVPIAAGGALAAPSLGLQPLLAGAGLAACVLFLVLGDDRWPAWVSFGLALAMGLALMAGSARLLSDERPLGSAGQGVEEQAAGLAGVVLPIIATVALSMALAGSGITTIG
jgi:hypothetical protein